MFRFSTFWCLLAVLGCSSVLGCAHTKPRPEVALPPPPPSAIEKLKAGSTLVVTRPTPNVARLSLWIDAGSRAAQVPQLATATAYWAEEKSGIRARVLPDGTEFSLLCDTQGRGLEHCVKRLVQVFALPAPNASDAERIRARLRTARIRALGDGNRDADKLAFEALFDAGSAGLFPLGKEEDDAQVESGSIARFARENYAAQRALLIAAGDTTEGAVAQAFAANAPKAATGVTNRAERSLSGRSSLRVQLGREDTLALALLVPNTDVAASLGQRLRKLYPTLTAHVTNLQGARLLSLRLPAGTKPARRLQRLVYDVRRLSLESTGTRATRPEESLEAITRLIGEDWAARGPVPVVRYPWPLGAAVVLRSDSVTAGTEEKRVQDLTKELETAIANAERNSLGEISGAADASASSVTAANSARIETRRREGDAWMSAVIRFQGGSALDPLTRHGRGALLATLMSDGCSFASASSLDAHLVHLDARLQPLISANRTGLLVTAPQERWAEAIDTLLQCALAPTLTSRALDDARLKLTRTLRSRMDLRWQGFLGTLLAPTNPGLIAPFGSADPVSSVHINEIRRLHSELLVGARISVLAVTAQPADEVARYVARRVGQLPKGSALSPLKDLKAPEPILGERTEPGALRVLVGLRTTGPAGGGLAAQVFASAFAQALAAKNLSVLTSWGDAAGEHAFSGTALALREVELAALERIVKEALTQVQRMPDATLQAALSTTRMERSASASSAQGYARAFFTEATAPPLKTSEELALIRKFAQSKAAFYVLRPKP